MVNRRAGGAREISAKGSASKSASARRAQEGEKERGSGGLVHPIKGGNGQKGGAGKR